MQGYSFQGVAVSAKPVLNFNCFFLFLLGFFFYPICWTVCFGK